MIMANPAMLPPGFRFHPTDEELIQHYLRNRAGSTPCPVNIIADVDIYKFDPWDLPCEFSPSIDPIHMHARPPLLVRPALELTASDLIYSLLICVRLRVSYSQGGVRGQGVVLLQPA
jgi:hypothetical protein